MAFLKNLLIICAYLALAQAAPVMDYTVTDTVTKTHYTTLNCVKTVWVPADQSPTSTAVSTSQGPSTTLIKSVLYRPTVTTTTTTTLYVPPPVPTSNYVAPTTSSLEPVPVTTTPAYTPPVAATTTEAPAYTPPSTTDAPAYTPPPTTEAPAPTTQAPVTSDSTPSTEAPAPSVASSASGGTVEASTSNNCQSMSDACEGDITHYDGGLGACGWNVDTASDMAVALPVGFMGTQSNGNPYCGRTITIKNPHSGTTIQAKVGDKCMGCEGRAIDLTDAAFTAVTDGTGDGRESGYEWWLD